MHVERWRTRCAGDLAGRELSIEGLTNTLSDVIVRIARADGSTQTLRVVPASPVFVVPTAPGGFEVARTYLVLGVGHILLGVDHLLFVLALLILAGARPMPLPRSDWAWRLPVYGIGVVASYWTLARVVRFWG